MSGTRIRKIVNELAVYAIFAAFLTIVGGLFYLDYKAYRERFPHAAPWTYLFRGGAR